MGIAAGQRVDAKTDPAGLEVLHPKIRLRALNGDFKAHRREAALLQPERFVPHGRVADDDHFHRHVDTVRDVLRGQRFEFLFSQQRLGLGGVHRDQLSLRDGFAEAIDDAGHRVVHRRMRADVRLAKRGSEQKSGQGRVRTRFLSVMNHMIYKRIRQRKGHRAGRRAGTLCDMAKRCTFKQMSAWPSGVKRGLHRLATHATSAVNRWQCMNRAATGNREPC